MSQDQKFFIDPETNGVYAYDAEGFEDSWVKEGLQPMTQNQVEDFFKAQEAASLPTKESLAEEAAAKRDSLLAVAAIRIAPLQDAIDEGASTSADEANLKKWKQYRIALNRIEQQPQFPESIDWPVAPT